MRSRDMDTKTPGLPGQRKDHGATCKVRSLGKNNLASRSKEINCCCSGHLVCGGLFLQPQRLSTGSRCFSLHFYLANPAHCLFCLKGTQGSHRGPVLQTAPRPPTGSPPPLPPHLFPAARPPSTRLPAGVSGGSASPVSSHSPPLPRCAPTDLPQALQLLRGCCLVSKWYPSLWDPVDCSPPRSSVQGISQARTVEWVAISFSGGSSRPRDQT